MNQLSIFDNQPETIHTNEQKYIVVWQDEKINPFSLVSTKEFTLRESQPMNQNEMNDFVKAIKNTFSIWYYIEIKMADSNEPAKPSHQNPTFL